MSAPEPRSHERNGGPCANSSACDGRPAARLDSCGRAPRPPSPAARASARPRRPGRTRAPVAGLPTFGERGLSDGRRVRERRIDAKKCACPRSRRDGASRAPGGAFSRRSADAMIRPFGCTPRVARRGRRLQPELVICRRPDPCTYFLHRVGRIPGSARPAYWADRDSSAAPNSPRTPRASAVPSWVTPGRGGPCDALPGGAERTWRRLCGRGSARRSSAWPSARRAGPRHVHPSAPLPLPFPPVSSAR